MYVKTQNSIANRASAGLAAVICTAATINMSLLIFAISGTVA